MGKTTDELKLVWARIHAERLKRLRILDQERLLGKINKTFLLIGSLFILILLLIKL